jgi:TonB family protein
MERLTEHDDAVLLNLLRRPNDHTIPAALMVASSSLPKTRVQRTRSSASPPHSPLTRYPLGGLWPKLLLSALVMGLSSFVYAQGISPREILLPRYPEAAQRARMEGIVELDMSVDGGGNVVGLDVLKSACPLLDDTAREAAQQWRFDARAGRLQVTVRFWLEDRGGEACSPGALWLAPGMVTVYGYAEVIDRSDSPL